MASQKCASADESRASSVRDDLAAARERTREADSVSARRRQRQHPNKVSLLPRSGQAVETRWLNSLTPHSHPAPAPGGGVPAPWAASASTSRVPAERVEEAHRHSHTSSVHGNARPLAPASHGGQLAHAARQPRGRRAHPPRDGRPVSHPRSWWAAMTLALALGACAAPETEPAIPRRGGLRTTSDRVG